MAKSMRTPARKFLDLYGASLGILVSLFALLCGCGAGRGGYAAEYGVVALYGALYSAFKIKGRVASSAGAKAPIPGIRVTLAEPLNRLVDNPGGVTDAAGAYESARHASPRLSPRARLDPAGRDARTDAPRPHRRRTAASGRPRGMRAGLPRAAPSLGPRHQRLRSDGGATRGAPRRGALLPFGQPRRSRGKPQLAPRPRRLPMRAPTAPSPSPPRRPAAGSSSTS